MFYVVSKAIWSVLSPSNALILVDAAGTLAIVFIYQQWIAGVVATTSIFLLAANFAPLWIILAKPLESRFIEPDLKALQVLGIIALGGDFDRLTVLADLGKRFPEAGLIFAGPGAPESAVRDEFSKAGGDLGRLSVEMESRSTAENASNVVPMLGVLHGGVYLLVTSALHMPRAMGAFQAMGVPVVAYPIDACSNSEFRAGPPALYMTNKVLKEWAGLLAYRLAGFTSDLFPAPTHIERQPRASSISTVMR
jgi:uncharacterized SAM-binding protein YcdF (DUF218 family)